MWYSSLEEKENLQSLWFHIILLLRNNYSYIHLQVCISLKLLQSNKSVLFKYAHVCIQAGKLRLCTTESTSITGNTLLQVLQHSMLNPLDSWLLLMCSIVPHRHGQRNLESCRSWQRKKNKLWNSSRKAEHRANPTQLGVNPSEA